MGKIAVAPLVGAWIEMWLEITKAHLEEVAPLVGAWIEIERVIRDICREFKSLPLWERGLKSRSTITLPSLL